MRISVSTVLALLVFALSVCVSEVRGQDTTETIRIDSDLVDLKVSVLGFAPNAPAPLLEQKDFRILEDGVPQEITFFAAADAPFDLVLLLDLSGVAYCDTAGISGVVAVVRVGRMLGVGVSVAPPPELPLACS